MSRYKIILPHSEKTKTFRDMKFLIFLPIVHAGLFGMLQLEIQLLFRKPLKQFNSLVVHRLQYV